MLGSPFLNEAPRVGSLVVGQSARDDVPRGDRIGLDVTGTGGCQIEPLVRADVVLRDPAPLGVQCSEVVLRARVALLRPYCPKTRSWG